MIELFEEQLSVTTAEEGVLYFTGELPAPAELHPKGVLPPGIYRVIDNVLFRIVPGLPPQIDVAVEK